MPPHIHAVRPPRTYTPLTSVLSPRLHTSHVCAISRLTHPPFSPSPPLTSPTPPRTQTSKQPLPRRQSVIGASSARTAPVCRRLGKSVRLTPKPKTSPSPTRPRPDGTGFWVSGSCVHGLGAWDFAPGQVDRGGCEAMRNSRRYQRRCVGRRR